MAPQLCREPPWPVCLLPCCQPPTVTTTAQLQVMAAGALFMACKMNNTPFQLSDCATVIMIAATHWLKQPIFSSELKIAYAAVNVASEERKQPAVMQKWEVCPALWALPYTTRLLSRAPKSRHPRRFTARRLLMATFCRACQ